MQRFFCLLVVAGCMFVSTVSLAAEQIGVYVVPKFIYGVARMDKVISHGNVHGEQG